MELIQAEIITDNNNVLATDNNNVLAMITDLQKKYKENPYMLQRLQLHLTNFPNLLEQENKRYEERVSRFNELSLEQDNFYKVFLSKHQYYYMPHNNIYYEYDGKTYKIVKDDDIHHTLLSTITDEGKLIQWKHKTKQNIVKKIKERTLFKSTPETYTIQNVLGFLQTIFQSKIEAKYFLTVIGDCLLKKNCENVLYFVSSNVKKLVTLVDAIGYITTGNSIMNNFITKYHDTHKINLYRLIRTNETENAFSYDITKDILNQIGIDLLCVAAHYSDRYTNADTYLKVKADDPIKNYILYFAQNPLDKIVDDFVSQCIEKVAVDTNITWKNVHYIWKLFLTNTNIPNMIYATQLQSVLLEKLEHNNDNGNITFLHITSKYLPSVSSFLSFWEKYITITSDNSFDDEYEVDELITLYKNSDQKNSQISDVNMLKMISHYFSPQVEIIDNKYITNIKCTLWSKHDDISEFLNQYKGNMIVSQITQQKQELISIDELYQGYKSYFKAKSVLEQKNLPIVSKDFFEKYVANQLALYIQFDKFVSSEWLQV
jgi:hypothetical protein